MIVLMTSRNGVRSGTMKVGTIARRPRRPARRDGLERQLDPEPRAAAPGRVELGDQPALRAGVAAQAHAGRQHDPVGLEPRRRMLDLDRVRARHAPLERVGAAGEELEPSWSCSMRSRSRNAADLPGLFAHYGRDWWSTGLPHRVRPDAERTSIRVHHPEWDATARKHERPVASVRRHGQRRRRPHGPHPRRGPVGVG